MLVYGQLSIPVTAGVVFFLLFFFFSNKDLFW